MPLWQLVAMALALIALLLGALLLGWRLGRESVQKPMWQTTAPKSAVTAAGLLPDEDPWLAARHQEQAV